MIDTLRLNGRPGFARLDSAETAIAATPDDGRDARTSALDKISAVRANLRVSTSVVEALEGRLQARPAPPAGQALQDLVRNARRRVAELRHRSTRVWIQDRSAALDRLRTALDR